MNRNKLIVRCLCTVLIVVLLGLSLTSCAILNEEDDDKESLETYKIAMLTDSADINDHSYNQIVYEACRDFSRENGIEFKYYKPASSAEADITAMIDLAVAQENNVIVMPGYMFAKSIVNSLDRHSTIKFMAVDIAQGDILESVLGTEYDYNPNNWKIEDYQNIDNLCCLNYREELPGFLAGYAAVKLGYTKIGFLGGMAVPSVLRYGYGYLQGIEQAASEMDITIDVNFAYANQFYGDSDISAVMDTWYKNGYEIVFACGGTIYDSVGQSASNYGGKIIGVDVDQREMLDQTYGEGITVTSAMKGVGSSTKRMLDVIVKENNWDKVSGEFVEFGLFDEDNPTIGYCGLPIESTQFAEGFTKEDYERIVSALENEEYIVSEDTSKVPKCKHINLHDFGGIK